MAVRLGRGKSHLLETLPTLKVRHFEIDSPRPQVRGQAQLRRETALGKVAVPLSPCGRFAVRKVEGIDEAQFQDLAKQSKENCPISVALSAVPIELSVKLVK